MTDFDAFRAAVAAHRPRTAVVLGSGLGAAAAGLEVVAQIAYADVPGLAPPTVKGHGGRLAVGRWGGVPAVVCFGRVHFYEGHSWDRVTALVRLLAESGVRSVLLTNAAGGIRPDLTPGSLMAIRAHLKLLEPDGWKHWPVGPSGRVALPYSPRLTALLQHLDAALPAGTYAALTGPCYETPAEIRALRHAGADAVGMSTAVEAEAAGFELEVAGLSCITNQAAGLSAGPLSHAEVEGAARDAVGRVADLIGRFVAAA